MEIKERVERIENRLSNIEKDLEETVRFQKENTKDLGILINETKEIVSLHRDIQGLIKAGTVFQRFCVWLAKLAAALSGVYFILQELKVLV